ncbi:MAG TPA: aromatic ring-hydroxylating dioxygenase subunit alpha [Steroidobacteraceae bacterium]|nr:aromatic ring-hydroxylating dioxygenase subunit alpha [Steroidobacteraceae bacterium]
MVASIESPEVALACTPPASFYTDPARLARERATVFRRSWQYVGHATQLARPGDYFTARIAHEPLVLVNDGGVIRGFFNVCRHRAGPVALGCGNAARLVCRYHGWTYSLQGQLLRAPEMEEAAQFDPAKIHLEPVAVHVLGPLVFAALEISTPAFDIEHPRLTDECAPFQLARMRHVMTREYPVAANWKLYVDNFLEGYHLPQVHPALSREIDYKSYATELDTHRVLQHAPVRTGTGSLYTPAAGEPAARYYWLFPNLMLSFYERQLQVNVVIPDGIDRTVVRFDWFALDAGPQHSAQEHFRRLVEFSDLVQAEDAAICQLLQGNVQSSAYRSGPYCPAREAGVQLFHRLMLGRVP